MIQHSSIQLKLSERGPLHGIQSDIQLLCQARVCCRHLAKHPTTAWKDIPNLPKAAVTLLHEKFAHLTTSVVQCQTSSSADTTKLLLRLQNGMDVEAVIMHYDTTGESPRAATSQEH